MPLGVRVAWNNVVSVSSTTTATFWGLGVGQEVIGSYVSLSPAHDCVSVFNSFLRHFSFVIIGTRLCTVVDHNCLFKYKKWCSFELCRRAWLPDEEREWLPLHCNQQSATGALNEITEYDDSFEERSWSRRTRAEGTLIYDICKCCYWYYCCVHHLSSMMDVRQTLSLVYLRNELSRELLELSLVALPKNSYQQEWNKCHK